MAASPGEFAVIIVTYNGAAFLEDCLASLFASPDAPPVGQVVVVDNASSDGSADWVQRHYPGATLLRSQSNLGFAGGNNLGFDHIRRHFPQVRYVALLNQDTHVRPGWIAALAEALEDDASAAAAQAALLLYEPKDCYNSAGNWSHYLGFGFVNRFGEPFSPVDSSGGKNLDFASGAAMMVRVSELEGETLFDPSFGSYLEDAELGWRLRLRGRRIVYAPASVVEHKYRFAQNARFYEQLERNRWFLLLTYYRRRTLLLLLPAILAMEAGLLVFFSLKGTPGVKLRAMRVVLSKEWRQRVREARQHAQSRRAISDRTFTSGFGSRVDFPHIQNPLLKYVGNPLLGAYWAIARRLICW